MTRKPIISIITPVYNSLKYIELCINNIIDQKSSDVEHIIVDGNSTDGSIDVIRKYANNYDHIRWVSEPDEGQSDAMNKGIEMARGEFISFLNVDDYYEDQAINRVIEVIRQNPSRPRPTILYSNLRQLDELAQVVKVRKPNSVTLFNVLQFWNSEAYPANPVSYFYHRSLHDIIGKYDVNQHYTMDYDFFLKASSIVNTEYYDEVWGTYQMVEGAKTVETLKTGGSRKIKQALFFKHIHKLENKNKIKILLRFGINYKLTRWINKISGFFQLQLDRIKKILRIFIFIPENRVHHPILDKPKVAIISPQQAPYSATFIQAHIDYIKARIIHLFGVFFPLNSNDKTFEIQEKDFIKKTFTKFNLTNIYRKLFLNDKLATFLKEEKIDLVLAEFGPVGAEVNEVCKQVGVPLIVYFHGYDAYLFHLLKEYRKEYHAMFEYASYLIVVSYDMKQQLISIGAPIEKMIVNPCSPNDLFFSIKPKFSPFNFLAVGRFVNKKAPQLTIQAFALAAAKVPHVSLTMAGDGPLLQECKQLVYDLKLTEKVHFAGAVSHQEILKLYENACCFVQHSVVGPDGDSEGTPVAILEAGAASLPVIATKHAGIKDVVIHEKTGYLIDEHDVKSMGKYMIKLSKDMTLTKEMGDLGRSHVKENYTMKNHINVIDQLIKKSIAT